MTSQTNLERPGELVGQIASNINKCSFQEGKVVINAA
jgi:hypothetical protein